MRPLLLDGMEMEVATPEDGLFNHVQANRLRYSSLEPRFADVWRSCQLAEVVAAVRNAAHCNRGPTEVNAAKIKDTQAI